MASLLSSPSSPTKEKQPGLRCSILCSILRVEVMLPIQTLHKPSQSWLRLPCRCRARGNPSPGAAAASPHPLS